MEILFIYFCFLFTYVFLVSVLSSGMYILFVLGRVHVLRMQKICKARDVRCA